MAHTSQDELDQTITAAEQVEVGGVYFHYKNPENFYIVNSIALIESNQEVAVVYQALYGKEITWIRPLEEFLKKFTLVK